MPRAIAVASSHRELFIISLTSSLEICPVDAFRPNLRHYSEPSVSKAQGNAGACGHRAISTDEIQSVTTASVHGSTSSPGIFRKPEAIQGTQVLKKDKGGLSSPSKVAIGGLSLAKESATTE